MKLERGYGYKKHCVKALIVLTFVVSAMLCSIGCNAPDEGLASTGMDEVILHNYENTPASDILESVDMESEKYVHINVNIDGEMPSGYAFGEEVAEDIYVGAYNDYEVGEPFLHIQKMDDGTYRIQISIFGLATLDCKGAATDNGLEFFDNFGVAGIITMEEDVATVKITSSEWLLPDTEYEYYRISDTPDIYIGYVAQDIYVGAYNDYEINEPLLHVKKMDDGTYQVEIGIFRIITLHCKGFVTDKGLEFADEIGVSGIITVSEDVATVKITSPGWLPSDKEYEYYKISNVPDAFVFGIADWWDFESGQAEIIDDIYVGVYNDYAVDEPSLMIQKMDNGTYWIEMDIFRFATIFSEGYVVDGGLMFYHDFGGTGMITFDDGVATIKINDQSGLTTIMQLKCYKILDINPKVF